MFKARYIKIYIFCSAKLQIVWCDHYQLFNLRNHITIILYKNSPQTSKP
jgi:hypothetical protein